MLTIVTAEGEEMKCKCGFEFAGAGGFRNCEAFITNDGKGGVICPACNQAYVDSMPVNLAEQNKKGDLKNADG